MMFGFGKALDVMQSGEPVRRHIWRLDEFLLLVDRARFDITETDRLAKPLKGWIGERACAEPYFERVQMYDGVPHVQPWVAISHEDLLAEDWEYVIP